MKKLNIDEEEFRKELTRRKIKSLANNFNLACEHNRIRGRIL